MTGFLVFEEIADDIGLFGLALLSDDVKTLHGTGESHIEQVEIVQTVAFLLFFNLLRCQIAHVFGIFVQFEQHFLQIWNRDESQFFRSQPFLCRFAWIQLFVQIDDGLWIDDHGKLQAFRFVYRHDIHRIAAHGLHGKRILFLVPKRQELSNALLRSRLPLENLLQEVVQKRISYGVEMEDSQQVGAKVVEAGSFGKSGLKQTRFANAQHGFHRFLAFCNGFHIVKTATDITFKIRILCQFPVMQHIGDIRFIVAINQIPQCTHHQLDLIGRFQQNRDLRNDGYSPIIQEIGHFGAIVRLACEQGDV